MVGTWQRKAFERFSVSTIVETFARIKNPFLQRGSSCQSSHWRVFLSYSREDFPFASRLAEDLSGAGMTAWLDKRDISPGQRWDSAVESGLTGSNCVLAILSPAAVNSSNVLDDISLALETNKIIVPILYRDCAIPFRLRRFQYLDFRGEYVSAYQELLVALTEEPRGSEHIIDHKR